MTNADFALEGTQLDVRVLDQLARDSGAAIIPKILTMFLDDGYKLLAQIESAIAMRDDNALVPLVHKLCGNTASCGLMGLAQILRDCETSFRSGDITLGRSKADQVVKLAPSAFEELSNYLEILKVRGNAPLR